MATLGLTKVCANTFIQFYKVMKGPDMGYFLGYMICESYYKYRINKAISNIIIISGEGTESFLEESGYKTPHGVETN
jgi:hypothetical protein